MPGLGDVSKHSGHTSAHTRAHTHTHTHTHTQSNKADKHMHHADVIILSTSNAKPVPYFHQDTIMYSQESRPN